MEKWAEYEMYYNSRSVNKVWEGRGRATDSR